jgi:HAMP domain-containing protein
LSLTARLSAFFLLALGLVLAGFSVSLYLLARTYLLGQAKDRVGAALQTLAAAVDAEPGGLEWEGDERRLTLGRDAGPEQARWEVRDKSGDLVARSANLGTSGPLPFSPLTVEDRDAPPHRLRVDHDGEPWLFMRRTLWAAPGDPAAPESPAGSGPRRYDVLVLTAGVSLAPAHAILSGLALALAGLSLGLWLVAAALGHRLCRRALAPVARMADAARAMGATDLSQRLPGPPTADELGALHRSFNGLLDRLQEAFERQRRFTGDASHQLRTPLAVMIGEVEVTLRRDRPAEEYRRALAALGAQAGRLRQIVEALLFLARADAEAAPGPLDEVDLSAWLPEHLRSWTGHPRAADLHQEGAGGPLVVRVQPAPPGPARG